jgi:hypothetical protein
MVIIRRENIKIYKIMVGKNIIFLHLDTFSPDDDPLGLKHVAIIKTYIVFIIKIVRVRRLH